MAALDAAVGPRGRAGVSPHAPYTVGPELWAALRAHPGLAGRPWATHLAESADEEAVIATGDGPLGALFAGAGLAPGRWEGPPGAGPVARVAAAGVTAPGLVAAHCVRLGGDDPGTLARAGIGVAHCPRSNVHLRCGRAPIEALRAAGVPVGLGTDSPASGGDYDLRAEARACREAHGGRLALDDDALLRLITIDAARVLGLDAEVGHLAPGARADLICPAPGRPRRRSACGRARRRGDGPDRRRRRRGPAERRRADAGRPRRHPCPGRARPAGASASVPPQCSSTRSAPAGWCRSSRYSPRSRSEG